MRAIYIYIYTSQYKMHCTEKARAPLGPSSFHSDTRCSQVKGPGIRWLQIQRRPFYKEGSVDPIGPDQPEFVNGSPLSLSETSSRVGHGRERNHNGQSFQPQWLRVHVHVCIYLHETPSNQPASCTGINKPIQDALQREGSRSTRTILFSFRCPLLSGERVWNTLAALLEGRLSRPYRTFPM